MLQGIGTAGRSFWRRPWLKRGCCANDDDYDDDDSARVNVCVVKSKTNKKIDLYEMDINRRRYWLRHVGTSAHNEPMFESKKVKQPIRRVPDCIGTFYTCVRSLFPVRKLSKRVHVVIKLPICPFSTSETRSPISTKLGMLVMSTSTAPMPAFSISCSWLQRCKRMSGKQRYRHLF